MAEVHVCLICADSHYYLKCMGEGIVQGYESADKGIEAFEHMYHKAAARSQEAAMSAFLFGLQFRPRIASLKEESILGELVGGAPYQISRLASEAGRMEAIACVGPRAADIYASAREPLVASGHRLSSEDL